MSSNQLQCECGNTKASIHGPALMRGFCHCTICQEFNQAPFADITLFRTRDIEGPADGQVNYRCWKKPQLVLRGVCKDCGKPAVEQMKLPGLPRITIVPTANLAGPVPEPSLHVFYQSRVADIDDDLPKVSGFLRSQMRFSQHLLSALLRS